jgi:hypothetical protein
MPLFIDVHMIDGGVSVEDVAKALVADLEIQNVYHVRYLRYWVDEREGRFSAWWRRPRVRPQPPCAVSMGSWPTRSTR